MVFSPTDAIRMRNDCKSIPVAANFMVNRQKLLHKSPIRDQRQKQLMLMQYRTAKFDLQTRSSQPIPATLLAQQKHYELIPDSPIVIKGQDTQYSSSRKGQHKRIKSCELQSFMAPENSALTAVNPTGVAHSKDVVIRPDLF